MKWNGMKTQMRFDKNIDRKSKIDKFYDWIIWNLECKMQLIRSRLRGGSQLLFKVIINCPRRFFSAQDYLIYHWTEIDLLIRKYLGKESRFCVDCNVLNRNRFESFKNFNLVQPNYEVKYLERKEN
jgi:hypothetical protein